ncbi:hypothetical protein FF011L_10240 [Roseimaritima multifibrata]|uniref:Uncharacterized protein n=1 Tax=Roseimaritima multifibrata TaxID=1930274 RepID=A0A517MBM9_9BACT|nr:hypothetical protein [Roseimaritima multifibrata]QDS92282.1 hypothetical protein FF011L_10240 [Roseimaritima multifibrata]
MLRPANLILSSFLLGTLFSFGLPAVTVQAQDWPALHVGAKKIPAVKTASATEPSASQLAPTRMVSARSTPRLRDVQAEQPSHESQIEQVNYHRSVGSAAPSCGCEDCRPAPRLRTAVQNCGCGSCQLGGPPCRAPLRRLMLPPNPIYCVLDKVAGGVECVLGLSPNCRVGRCALPGGGDCGCDTGGCDSMGCDCGDSGRDAHPATLLPVPKPHPTMAPMPPSTEKAVEEIQHLPAPIVPDRLKDPFKDDQAWIPGSDRTIQRSAYYE